MTPKIVLVIGATGLVGSQLVKLLDQDPQITEIRCLVRKPATISLNKTTFNVVDFMNLDRAHHLFDNVNHIFCCIGTTMKDAQSKQQFYFVDYQIPQKVAEIGKEKGISAYSLVSSVGAHSKSLSFYLKTKGSLEDQLQKLGFKQLIIYRPSFLLGQRHKPRLTEKWMLMLFRLFFWLIPKRLKPTDSENLATLMVDHFNTPHDGTQIYEPYMMQ